VCVAEKDSDLKQTAKFARIQEREHFSKTIESLKIKNSQQSLQITSLKNCTVDAEIQKKKAEFQEQQSTRHNQDATKYTKSLQKKSRSSRAIFRNSRTLMLICNCKLKRRMIS
jgi:hypothetical protein